jgi:hypothetical protein
MLEEREGADAQRVTLATLVRGEQDTFFYEYDFGDGWDHELRLEKALPGDAGQRYPRCLRANALVRPRIAGASGGTRTFWPLSEIRNTPSMQRWWHGSVVRMTQRPLLWTRSMGSSTASKSWRWGESDDKCCGPQSIRDICATHARVLTGG